MLKTDFQVVLGLGKTGISCIRFLRNKGYTVIAMDEHNSIYVEEIRRLFPEVILYLNGFNRDIILKASRIVVSPGVPLSHSFLQEASQNIPIIGDIELFSQETKKPIIAITGSNGKSTVTALVGEMFKNAGKQVGVGGNLGTAALDLLELNPDYFILELSSFQLESMPLAKFDCACLLNISADHLDRYSSFELYAKTKRSIHKKATWKVFNIDDELTYPEDFTNTINYGLSKPKGYDWGIISDKEIIWLAQGDKKIIQTNQMQIFGRHNWSNALAALAIGSIYRLSVQSMCDTLKKFKGLIHRTQKVRELNGITWVNDSKATNVGATLACINGIEGTSKNINLIAGGLGKGQDFNPLRASLEAKVKNLILLGKDADILENQLKGSCNIYRVNNLKEAVNLAALKSISGDVVLLSPACASLDMFKDYTERGEIFCNYVLQLT